MSVCAYLTAFCQVSCVVCIDFAFKGISMVQEDDGRHIISRVQPGMSAGAASCSVQMSAQHKHLFVTLYGNMRLKPFSLNDCDQSVMMLCNMPVVDEMGLMTTRYRQQRRSERW